MAEVDTIPVKNCASDSPFLNFLSDSVYCKFSHDSTSKCEFDGSSLLIDRAHSGKNYNGDSKIKNNDVETFAVSLSEDLGPTFTSLSSLAEDHLKNDRMFPDFSFQDTLSLSDVLTNDNCSSMKSTVSADNLNFFDLCFGDEDDFPKCKQTSVPESNVSLDVLSEWMDSSLSHAPRLELSLESLTTSPFLKSNLENQCINDTSAPSAINLKNGNSDHVSSIGIDDVLSPDKSSKGNITVETDLLDMFIESSSDNFSITDSLDRNKVKNDSAEETSDCDFFSDIDLNFCIKKNSKDPSSSQTVSPESEDSGFAELDFKSFKSYVPFKTSFENILSQKDSCPSKKEKISCSKPSLFSQAISVKPKVNDAKKSKLAKIRSELLKGNLSLNIVNASENSQNTRLVIDNSEESVIHSSYLKVPLEL